MMEARAGGSQPEMRDALRGLSRLWWLWLVFGVAWTLIAVTILQFDDASVTTVGVIIGLMFFATGLQQFAIAVLIDRGGWLFGLFGVLFVACGVITFISPENTFASIADILGFLFLIVGVFWVIEAFGEKGVNDLWWLGLIGGILMLVLAFWTGGQLLIHKQYMLLVFAGIWALMHGVIDISRAFQIRELRNL
jgi:uncharacterized membrane protein HdeD (DUF308 family)